LKKSNCRFTSMIFSLRTLELCLSEVSRCQFFIGILGDRYGWVPDKYIVPDTPEFAWVREFRAGASVTELEMQAGALGLTTGTDKRDTAFMFIRDNAFERLDFFPYLE